jgi:hypothetical protein
MVFSAGTGVLIRGTVRSEDAKPASKGRLYGVVMVTFEKHEPQGYEGSRRNAWNHSLGDARVPGKGFAGNRGKAAIALDT